MQRLHTSNRAFTALSWQSVRERAARAAELTLKVGTLGVIATLMTGCFQGVGIALEPTPVGNIGVSNITAVAVLPSESPTSETPTLDQVSIDASLTAQAAGFAAETQVSLDSTATQIIFDSTSTQVALLDLASTAAFETAVAGLPTATTTATLTFTPTETETETPTLLPFESPTALGVNPFAPTSEFPTETATIDLTGTAAIQFTAFALNASPTPFIPTAFPTLTPLPTYTPIPSQTLLPTYTPFPTNIPTQTPYPTFTPLPTQVPPTQTPLPTYTPQPTYTPFPTEVPPTGTIIIPTSVEGFILAPTTNFVPAQGGGGVTDPIAIAQVGTPILDPAQATFLAEATNIVGTVTQEAAAQLTLTATFAGTFIPEGVPTEINPLLPTPADTSGGQIALPTGTAVAGQAGVAGSGAAGILTEDGRYIVEQGDRLLRIALRFSTTVTELRRVNGIVNENLISPGQILLIPGYYNRGTPTAVPGQSTPIPGVNPGQVISTLDLAPSPTLPPNVTIIVITATPDGRPASNSTYIVQEGDTLFSIAIRFKVNVTALAQYNGITNYNVIYLGQQIVIP